MEEENVTSMPENVDDTNNYIEAIKTIKENSVDKAAYDKLKEENKQLLQSLVKGEKIESKEEPVDINELRQKILTDESLTNLEYIESALKLRDELMKKGNKDPFLP